MVGVEQWAEIRRLHFVKGLSQREIRRRTGLHRDTIRRAINSSEPPVYRRAPAGSKLDPFKDEIHRLLREDPKLPGVRIRELLEPLGCTASKTVVDDYLREVRPLFAPRAADVSADGLSAGRDLPVRRLAAARGGPGRPRPDAPRLGRRSRAWATRARAPASWSSRRETEDLLAGIAGCLERLGGLPRTLVWDRQAGIHGHGGRPIGGVRRVLRPAAGSTGTSASRPTRRPRASSSGCRATRRRTSSPAARFANELDFQDQLDAWFAKVNARTHKTLRARPVDRLADELEVMAPLPDRMPDTARRWTTRVPPDPHLRLDTNDYSLDPALVGRRVEVIVDQRTVTAVALDTGEVACRHARVFARHRTITALEHARALRAGRGVPAETPVEVRPLARYDALIA